MDSENWNINDIYKGLPYHEILAAQENVTLPYAVCILDIDGDLNTASIIRTACCMGAEKTFVFGKRKLDRRGLVGAQNYIDIERVDGVQKVNGLLSKEKFDLIMKENNYTPVFVETSGTDITKFDWNKISGKICLVVGNENIGIPRHFMISNSHVVSVPMFTVMRSLNVAVSAGIAIHELTRYYNEN